MTWKKPIFRGGILLAALLNGKSALAGDADIRLPSLQEVSFSGGLSGHAILISGLVICVIGALFGVFQYKQTRALQVHKSMGDVSQIIWETCKTYLWQQGKFLAALWILIAMCMVYYFWELQGKSIGNVLIILAACLLYTSRA